MILHSLRPLVSIGSSGRVGRGPRNMKSMWPPLAAIFFMTHFYRAGGGGMAPSAPPGSATASNNMTCIAYGTKVNF